MSSQVPKRKDPNQIIHRLMRMRRDYREWLKSDLDYPAPFNILAISDAIEFIRHAKPIEKFTEQLES